jgi:hypothetical protein
MLACRVLVAGKPTAAAAQRPWYLYLRAQQLKTPQLQLPVKHISIIACFALALKLQANAWPQLHGQARV